ncbi:MAG: glycosyltransferase family 2 protein [Deltaproteobacteria bacterium]|nr:glycosyltransferase family 2 protein [Deltaproteobacteria bacterium]
MKHIPHIEIILPVFNEVENIQPLLRELDRVGLELKDEAKLTYLFINDGSADGTKELLHRLHRDRSDIRMIDLIHNFGHAPAIACGLEYFDADIAALMDADLQDSPQSLVQMFQAWKQGAKTVVAQRGKRSEKGRMLFHAFYFLLHKTATHLPSIDFGTHCLLDRSVVDRLRRLPERNRYFPGLVSYSSGPIASIRIDRNARFHGHSRVGLLGLLSLAITALVSFSSRPVRLVAIMGLLASICSITAAVVFVSIKIFTEKAIPGWASLMTSMAFASGIQLLCLGIIGEYIARIYDEVKQRPLFLVDRVFNLKDKTRSEVA